MVLEPCLPQQGGCGAEAAEGHSGGPEKAARRCCHSCESARKNWQRRRRRRRSNWGRHLVGPLFLRDEFQPSTAWSWACSGTHNKYAQSNQNISKQILDMFPRFFLELPRSKKLELRELQLQPERRHQAREGVYLRRRSRQPRGA